MHVVLNPAIQIGGNQVLQKGIPIPLIGGVELSDKAALSVEDGAIRCDADFIYTNQMN
jgi:hypothetical protein